MKSSARWLERGWIGVYTLFDVCSHAHHGSFEAEFGVGRTIPLGLES